MRRLTSAFTFALLPLFVPGPVAAQEHMHDEEGEHEHMEGHDMAVRSVAPLFKQVSGYLLAAAEQVPGDLYDYRPTEEVMTFGQILGHVANAQYAFCGAATGEGGSPPENFEERSDKAGIVEGLRTAFAACEPAYEMEDGRAMEETQVFGRPAPRLYALTYNVAHNFEHYGNLVTYMRANGLTPPSSQGGM